MYTKKNCDMEWFGARAAARARRAFSAPRGAPDAWSRMRRGMDEAMEIASAWGRTAGAVVQFGCTVYVMRLYVVDATLCVGPSMDPTCEP